MGAAENLFAEIKQFFDQDGVKYTVINEADNLMRLAFAPTSSKDGGGVRTRVLIDLDEVQERDGSCTVHFACLSAGKCEEAKIPEAIVRINALNKRYRWVKFWFDDSDNTINADADAVIFPGTVGMECKQFAFRMSDIVEDALIDLRDIFTPEDGGGDTPSRDDLLALLEALRGMMG